VNVKEDQIRCLANDLITVRTGSENCFPYWLEGEEIVIGKKLDDTDFRMDKFTWLTNESVECGLDGNGQKLTG